MPHTDPVAKAEYFRAYRERNREKLVAMGKLYRESNASRLAERKHEDYLQNMDAYKRRAKEHRERNAEKIKAQRSTPEYKTNKNSLRRERYESDPNYKAHILDAQKQFLNANRDDINARRAAKRESNPEKYREQRRQWCLKNPEKVREMKHENYVRNLEREREKRRNYYAKNKKLWSGRHLRRPYWQQKFYRGITKARRKGSEVVDTQSLREFYRQVFEKPEAVCEYCRGVFCLRDITIDHRQPFVLKGKHEVSNFAVSCLPCNLKKGEKPYEAWRSI
jgi:hypothetical protein